MNGRPCAALTLFRDNFNSYLTLPSTWAFYDTPNVRGASANAFLSAQPRARSCPRWMPAARRLLRLRAGTLASTRIVAAGCVGRIHSACLRVPWRPSRAPQRRS
jgi:hypothetical protein